MEWKVEENSKVAGTFPPMARTERKWTGYVEKDTAGQTNIYAVEVSYIFSIMACGIRNGHEWIVNEIVASSSFLVRATISHYVKLVTSKFLRSSFDGGDMSTVSQKRDLYLFIYIFYEHQLPVGHHFELATFHVGGLCACHILESGSVCLESPSCFRQG